MAHTRVLDISDGSRPKLSRAKRLIAMCAYEWYEQGVSIRRLTLAESLQAQAEQAQARALKTEVLQNGEVGGCRFIPPANATYRAPWSAIEAMEAPMMVKACRYPRQANQMVAA